MSVLRLENVKKTFEGGPEVLRGISLTVEEGEVMIILEAMKMETEIRAFRSGTLSSVSVKVGDCVNVGDCLVTIA